MEMLLIFVLCILIWLSLIAQFKVNFYQNKVLRLLQKQIDLLQDEILLLNNKEN